MTRKPASLIALLPLLLAVPAAAAGETAAPGKTSSETATEPGIAEQSAAAKDPFGEVTLDFGDHSSSTLTTKAWDAFGAKSYKSASVYANKCIELYREQAMAMQKGLTSAPTEKEAIAQNWALNDVGTCYYILGQVHEAQGRKKEAIAAYQTLVKELPLAHCWDTKGWYWKPADPARERIKALEFETLE